MRHYVLKNDQEYDVQECLARPIKGEVSLTRNGVTSKYKVGDFVLLSIDDAGEFRFEFMVRKDFGQRFTASDNQDESPLKAQVATRISGDAVDPFRPKRAYPPDDMEDDLRPEYDPSRLTPAPEKVRLKRLSRQSQV